MLCSEHCKKATKTFLSLALTSYRLKLQHIVPWPPSSVTVEIQLLKSLLSNFKSCEPDPQRFVLFKVQQAGHLWAVLPQISYCVLLPAVQHFGSHLYILLNCLLNYSFQSLYGENQIKPNKQKTKQVSHSWLNPESTLQYTLQTCVERVWRCSATST